MVSLGGWAKGRSPSLLLNQRVRCGACFSIVGRKALGNTEVSTEENPADDPSRKKTLRPRILPPPWLSSLLDTEERFLSGPSPLLPRLAGGVCGGR